ncbi:hypothetical protein N7541_004692 [Penicillium brevicompactum]|uniref:Uncharacterized protein n=1 Tax=Penicillium brevicompactum TaxID=5074 RepID=A0A9W9UUY9_PENBR|nr:hypothetical protein N7541_004692 [Penicillium brevicompactum]
MEQLAQLVREVERVVTAPYVPSLQGLYDLLQQGCLSSIELWALCKPCQVGLIADVLVDALSRSRVAAPLIAAFASTRAARDAILERHPVILDNFLEKAVNGESEYDSACIAFFKSPLPDGFVPPARIAVFISKLVSAMVANPCVDTVAPIHALIAGLKGSPRVLDDIPTETMSGLQTEFTKTLRNLDDHMGNILCLSTFAQIATARLAEPHNQHGSERQWLLNIRHFFGPKRGIKTLDLVVLRVILACSSSCNLGPQDAATSIRLAVDIADAIEPAQKQAWVASNSAKISKLCEKAAKDGLDHGIQKMAIVFLHALLPAQSLSSQLRGLGLRTLLSNDSHETLELISPQLITRLAGSLATTGEPATREIVAFVLGTFKGSEWKNMQSLATLRLAHLVLAGLRELDLEATGFNLNSSINPLRQAVGETIEHFPRTPSESQCSNSAICTSQLCMMQNRLFLSLMALYNTFSLKKNGGDIMMESFLFKVEDSLPDVRCGFSTTSPASHGGSFSLPETSRSSSTRIDRNWRAGITNVFMQNAQTHHDNMMRKIEETCFDLERRCEDVEGPLRIVEEERDRYALEAQHLRERTEELIKELKEKSDEVDAARRTSSEHLTEFGHEHTRLEQLLQEQYSHRDDLMRSIETLRFDLQEQQNRSENAIVSERDKNRSKELELMATITAKDDQVEELQEELVKMRSMYEQTCQTLAQASEENSNARETSGSLELELAGATQSLERFKLMNAENEDRISDLVGLTAQKDDQISLLLAREQDLRKELGSLETSVEQQASEHEKLQSAFQQSEVRSQAEIEKLNREAENQASRTANQISKQKAENQRLQADMQAAALEAANDAQSKDKRIHHLERKVQALRDERAAKAREFSEAQQHIGRLMGVMGFSSNAPESTPKHQRTRSNPYQTPAARSPQPISEDEDEDEDETQPQSSQYMPTGPTPKRPRSNHKTTAARAPSASSATMIRKSPPAATRSARRPLAAAAGNSPAKIPSSSGWKSSQVGAVPDTPAQENVAENRLQNLDLDMDLEFSKEFLFSSTAFTGSNERAEGQ